MRSGSHRRVDQVGVVTVLAVLLLGLSEGPPQGRTTGQGAQLAVTGRTRVQVRGTSGIPVQAINDVVATSDRLVVLEGETNSLLVLSLDGQTRSRVANTGTGGAMLGHPVQMALTNQGDILVLDAQTPRLARFSVKGDTATLQSVVNLGVTGVSGVCSLAGRTYILGNTVPVDKSRLFHMVDAKGSVISSYGDGFGPPIEVAKLLYGDGRLLSLPREGLIVVVPKSFPEVRGYDQQGNMRWKQGLPDYRQVSFEEKPPGNVTWTYPPDNVWDQTLSASLVTDGVLAVQIGRRFGRQPGTQPKSIRTVLLSTVDGRIIGAQTDVPLIKAATGARLFSVDEAGTLWTLRYSLSGR